MFVLYFITLCIIFTVLFLKYFGNKLWLSMKIPGPPALPIIGNGLLFLNKTPAEFVIVGKDLIAKYGKVMRLWLGPELHVLLNDPKDVEIVLTNQKFIEKSDDYSIVLPWLGDGLLLSTGKKWFSRRKVITPTFHFKILEQFVEIFDRQGRVFVDTMHKEIKKAEIFDIYPLVTLCALDVICESAMGTSTNAQINSDSEYVWAVKELAHIMHIRMFQVPMRYDFLFYLSSNSKRQKRALEIVHSFTDSVIKRRREELIQRNNNVESSGEENEFGIKRKLAFLDVLLQSTVDGKPLTNMDIREEVDTFMFEGHDTTTSAICFALYNLAKHPYAQQKVLEEIHSVLGNEDAPLTISQLNELHYTDLVIKETLRLFPSVPLFGRKLRENFAINGQTIPAGANVVISPFIMGRDPLIFEDPDTFRPERFDVVTSKDVMNPYAYVPFSAGQRNCIGQKFAVLELKSVITKVVRNFMLELPEEDYVPVVVAELIIRPEDGIKLKIKPRK